MEEKRKFNVIDLILITLVFLLVLSVIGKIVYPELFRTRSGAVSVSCTLETDDSLSPYAGSLSVGDRLFIGTDTPFGTVTEIKKGVLSSPSSGENGKEGEETQQRTVFSVTVVCSLVMKDGAYTVTDGTMILTGKDYILHTKDTAFTFVVKNLLEISTSSNLS